MNISFPSQSCEQAPKKHPHKSCERGKIMRVAVWIKALWGEDLHAMRLANNGPVFSQMPIALWRCSNLGLPDLILPGFVVHHLGADPSLGLPSIPIQFKSKWPRLGWSCQLAHLRCRNRGTYRKIHTFHWTKLIPGKLNQLGQLHSPTVPKLLLSLQLQVLPQRQECGDGRDVKTFHQEKILGPQQHRLKIPLVHLQWLKGEETAQLPKKKRCLNPMKSIGHPAFEHPIVGHVRCNCDPNSFLQVAAKVQRSGDTSLPGWKHKSGRNGFPVRVQTRKPYLPPWMLLALGKCIKAP